MKTKETDQQRINRVIAQKKKACIRAMMDTFGNVTASMEQIGLSRQTFYDWCNNDPDFKKQVDDIDFTNIKKDFFEHKLIRLVNKEDTAAVIFANKTYNRDRGYAEKTDLNISARIKHLVNEPLTDKEKKFFDDLESKI